MLMTAVVFFSVGFMVGYVYNAHQRSEIRTKAGPTSPGPSTDQTAALPPGHPPINSDSMFKALEEKAAESPQESGPPLQLANLLYDQQRYQEAAKWYAKALSLDPQNVNARTDLGTCYFNLGRLQDALREYRKSLERDPRHEPTLFNMIIVNLEGTRDLEAARAAWEELHRLNPNYPGLNRLKESLDSAGATGSKAPGRS